MNIIELDSKTSRIRWSAATAVFMAVLMVFPVGPALAQDEEPPQDEEGDEAAGLGAETKALDSTATQWSFQLAYQEMDYKTDTLDNGETRPAGLDNFVQLRIVMPFVFESFTLLPRVTLRHYENLNNGDSGFGNTEVFGLIIPKSWDWGSGRFGIGPLITLPGDEKVARDEWGYGLATALVNGSGNWFYGALLTQSWRSVDPLVLPAGTSDTNPLGIALFLNYLIGNGWYVSNGDMVAKYDWDSKKFYMPIGVRIGKILVMEEGTWNFYGEYQTSLIYNSWPGSAVDNSIRINATYSIPVGK